MRLHRLWRGATVDVYPTGRGSAGVQQGDGRSGASQLNRIERLVPQLLVGTSRCLESLVRGEAGTLDEQQIQG